LREGEEMKHLRNRLAHGLCRMRLARIFPTFWQSEVVPHLLIAAARRRVIGRERQILAGFCGVTRCWLLARQAEDARGWP